MKLLAPAIIARMENKPIEQANLPPAAEPAGETKAQVIRKNASAASSTSRRLTSPEPAKQF
jgi:hypothetical protein